MIGVRPDHNTWAHPCIKRDKTALVPDCQPEQVAVRDLPVPEQVVPVEAACIEQAVVGRNEGLAWVRKGSCEPLRNRLQWQRLRVRRLRHDAQAPILHSPMVRSAHGGAVGSQ